MNEQEARSAIEELEGGQVVKLVPDVSGEGDYVATFEDGHTVTFYTDDHHQLLENRVHIVDRSSPQARSERERLNRQAHEELHREMGENYPCDCGW